MKPQRRTTPMPAAKKPTAKSIWAKLSSINCNDHVEDKNGLTYLSWAWAWAMMMENFPELSVEWWGHTDAEGVKRDVCYYPGGTASVNCTVTIGDVEREMWLPVLNYRNQSIENPTSFEINTTKMRCLTKCFALFGLGFYIYEGESTPNGEDSTPDPYEAVKSDLTELINEVEKDTTSTIDADVLASAKSLLDDKAKPVARMQKAITFIQSQL